MENVTFIDLTDVISDEVKTFAIITNEDDSTTSMLKADYEAQQVEHLTEIVTDGAAE